MKVLDDIGEKKVKKAHFAKFSILFSLLFAFLIFNDWQMIMYESTRRIIDISNSIHLGKLLRNLMLGLSLTFALLSILRKESWNWIKWCAILYSLLALLFKIGLSIFTYLSLNNLQ